LYNTDVRGPLQPDAAIVRRELASATAAEINSALPECEFRRNPATDSDLKPATVPK
jgi:hypothetical protein